MTGMFGPPGYGAESDTRSNKSQIGSVRFEQ